MRSIPLCAVALLVLSGCFAYQPVQPATIPEPGTQVRVALEAPQTVPLRDLTANNVVSLAGEFAGVRDDTLLVSAWSLASAGGREYEANWQTVNVPRENVATIQEKRFSWLRTGALALLGVAASILTAEVVDDTGGNTPGPGPQPRPQ